MILSFMLSHHPKPSISEESYVCDVSVCGGIQYVITSAQKYC